MISWIKIFFTFGNFWKFESEIGSRGRNFFSSTIGQESKMLSSNRMEFFWSSRRNKKMDNHRFDVWRVSISSFLFTRDSCRYLWLANRFMFLSFRRHWWRIYFLLVLLWMRIIRHWKEVSELTCKNVFFFQNLAESLKNAKRLLIVLRSRWLSVI